MTETLMTAPPSELRGAFRQLAVAETYLQDGEIKVKDSFPICPSFGVVWYREVDLGFPDVRSSVQDNPESDGTFDSTRYIGAREVSITGVVIENAFGDLPDTEEWPPEVAWNSASWFCTLLSSWASPARRYRFYFHDGIRSRFMDCRGDSFSVNADRNGGEFREFQLGMVNPSGRIYTFAEGEGTTEDGRYAVDIRAAAADVAGRSYLLTYPRVYPTVSGTGASAVFYTGTIPTGFVAEIYTGSSPLTGPRITVTDPFGNRAAEAERAERTQSRRVGRGRPGARPGHRFHADGRPVDERRNRSRRCRCTWQHPALEAEHQLAEPGDAGRPGLSRRPVVGLDRLDRPGLEAVRRAAGDGGGALAIFDPDRRAWWSVPWGTSMYARRPGNSNCSVGAAAVRITASCAAALGAVRPFELTVRLRAVLPWRTASTRSPAASRSSSRLSTTTAEPSPRTYPSAAVFEGLAAAFERHHARP